MAQIDIRAAGSLPLLLGGATIEEKRERQNQDSYRPHLLCAPRLQISSARKVTLYNLSNAGHCLDSDQFFRCKPTDDPARISPCDAVLGNALGHDTASADN